MVRFHQGRKRDPTYSMLMLSVGRSAPTWLIDTMRSLMKTDSLLAWLTKPYVVAVHSHCEPDS